MYRSAGQMQTLSGRIAFWGGKRTVYPQIQNSPDRIVIVQPFVTGRVTIQKRGMTPRNFFRQSLLGGLDGDEPVARTHSIDKSRRQTQLLPWLKLDFAS